MKFYRLWLDRRLLCTCAYYPWPELSLEQAQMAKMDLVCRKLRLRPGERVAEAGCGWGALALHMDRCLTAEGRGLVHTIGTDRPGPLNSWIERRIAHW